MAQFCVNNWGDDISAKCRQFWGGYKLLYPTLLSLGRGTIPPPVPPGIAPVVNMAYCHRTLQLLNFLNVVMTGIRQLVKENQEMLSILILAKLSTVFRIINLPISLNHVTFVITLALIAFLTNRTWAVNCNTSVSSSVSVTAGTPYNYIRQCL